MFLALFIAGGLLICAGAVVVAGAVLGTNQRRWEELNAPEPEQTHERTQT